MNRKSQILWSVTAAALLVGVALSTGWRGQEAPMVPVVAAKGTIRAGQVVTSEDLMVLELPEKFNIQEYVTDPESVIGCASDRDLSEGQMIDRRWLHDQPAGIAFPDARADGRLYTLRLPAEHANGFWIAAGNRVDIHLIPKGEPHMEIPGILPDVRILSILGSGKPPADHAPQDLYANPSTDGSAMVCLDVNTAQAHVLALAESRYIVKLVPINEPFAEPQAIIQVDD